jgi:hypothetical protein
VLDGREGRRRRTNCRPQRLAPLRLMRPHRTRLMGSSFLPRRCHSPATRCCSARPASPSDTAKPHRPCLSPPRSSARRIPRYLPASGIPGVDVCDRRRGRAPRSSARRIVLYLQAVELACGGAGPMSPLSRRVDAACRIARGVNIRSAMPGQQARPAKGGPIVRGVDGAIQQRDAADVAPGEAWGRGKGMT